ncbi:MAG: xylulokinase [Lachnospiraceae bacterium]|nr:xylulokinase [Lachnospiraceae bacterium]
MANYVGIDIGTSSAKLTLINDAGEIIKESSREYKLLEPLPGWKEIDPEIWMYAVDSAMEEILENQDPELVKAIGVTGQMHTVVFVGKDGKSIRPALMWNDTRTNENLISIKRQIQENPKISHIANIISTGSPAMNLLWLKENEPENFHNIKKFLIGPDYIVYRLTGNCQTDYCEASTSSLFDLNEIKWSPEIRKLLDFPEDIYPEVKGTSEIAGELLPNWREKYHFSDGVQVLVGTGDNPAAAISTGCFAKKYPVLSFGTSGVLMYPKDKIDFTTKGKNIVFSFDKKEIMILVQGVVQSCGSSFAWWMRKVLETSDFNKETEFDILHLGEGNLFFYPHLVGDKTIYADADLRGSFMGIGTDTTRSEMTIAVMEGICYAVKQLTEVMKIPKETLENLKVIGGGSQNKVWMQILADILNVNVCQTESGAGAGYGMALAAAGTVGNTSMDEVIEKTVKVKEVFVPRKYNSELYQKKYQKYLKIHDAMKQIG